MPKPLRVRYRRIAQVVDGLLEKYRVNRPPVDIEEIAKREGLRISYERLDGELSGFLLKGNDRFTIGVNSSNSPPRQRFTIAHECGHAFLHDFDDVHIDRAFKLRSPLSSKAVDIEEIEANTFAAWILMPEAMLREDLDRRAIDVQGDEDIAALADAYEVSRQSMAFRVANLMSRSF